MIAECTTAAFKAEVIEADRPVLVDFHAAWCGPCQAQAPIIENIARSAGRDAKVVKVDIDRSPELAALFAVRSIPTLLLFNRGKIIHRFSGVTSGSTIAAALVGQMDRSG